MATYHINEAKTNLSTLVTAAEKGEEVVITRYGKPVARLSGIKKPKKRVLGFFPIDFQSDLLEPTDPAVIHEFYK
jgi:prevent-host-death family protein